MFKLLNLQSNAPLVVKVESPDNGDSTTLPLGPMISKRNKEELAEGVQYQLLNSYLNYKGVDFKKLLYYNIVACSNQIEESCLYRGLSHPPISTIAIILDMFDMQDVISYVRDIYRITVPENLKPSFDPMIENDGLGTRVQTYVQQDYYDLAALTIPIKVVSGLLCMYAIRKADSMLGVHREYILYGIFANHNIMKCSAVDKLREWSKVLIAASAGDSDTSAITVIEKQIPIEELPNFIVAVVLIQKLSIAAVITDNKHRNVITRIYNYIINKLKTKGSSGSKIREKKPLSDPDSGGTDKESILEAYRMVSDLSAGIEVELNWYVSNMELLVRDIGACDNMALLEEALQYAQCFREIPVAKEQVILAGYMFKKIIDPRSFDYIDIDGIINILSLGFVIAWTRGHRHIASLLISKVMPDSSDSVEVNTVPNVRLEKDFKIRLAELYPYQKQLNINKTESVIETSITDLTYDIFSKKWIPNIPEHCHSELFGTTAPRLLDPGFKNHLAKFIIDMEEYAYAE